MNHVTTGKTSDDLAATKKLFPVETAYGEVTDADMEHLKGMTNLRKLDLKFTDVTDAGLVHLKGLTKLQTLNLYGTKITDAGLEHLKGLTGLQTLNLGGTKITDAGMVHLKGLQLTSLVIPNDAKTDLGLKHYLAALETHTRISLENWRITDAGLVHLKGLTKLKTLYLNDTQVTDPGVAELQKALPKCRIQLSRAPIRKITSAFCSAAVRAGATESG